MNILIKRRNGEHMKDQQVPKCETDNMLEGESEECFMNV